MNCNRDRATARKHPAMCNSRSPRRIRRVCAAAARCTQARGIAARRIMVCRTATHGTLRRHYERTRSNKLLRLQKRPANYAELCFGVQKGSSATEAKHTKSSCRRRNIPACEVRATTFATRTTCLALQRKIALQRTIKETVA